MDFVVVIAHAEDRLQRSFGPSDFTDGTVGRLVTEEDYKVLEEVTKHYPPCFFQDYLFLDVFRQI